MTIEIGMTVEGGDGEDHDVGRVVDVAEGKALVAWQSGVRTWTPIEDLTEVES